MKTPNPERFKQDEDGQWWYHYGKKNPVRSRATIAVCERCGEEFVRSPVKKQDGTPVKNCSKECGFFDFFNNNPNHYKGERNGKWKGGKTMRKGYVLVLAPDHHSIKGRGTKRRYVLEHRIVMEKNLSRNLESHEQVHHINGIRDDNRPENLELWSVAQPTGQRVSEKPHCETCTCHNRDVP